MSIEPKDIFIMIVLKVFWFKTSLISTANKAFYQGCDQVNAIELATVLRVFPVSSFHSNGDNRFTFSPSATLSRAFSADVKLVYLDSSR
jgi:hypothetical protein